MCIYVGGLCPIHGTVIDCRRRSVSDESCRIGYRVLARVVLSDISSVVTRIPALSDCFHSPDTAVANVIDGFMGGLMAKTTHAVPARLGKVRSHQVPRPVDGVEDEKQQRKHGA